MLITLGTQRLKIHVVHRFLKKPRCRVHESSRKFCQPNALTGPWQRVNRELTQRSF